MARPRRQRQGSTGFTGTSLWISREKGLGAQAVRGKAAKTEKGIN